MNKYRNKKVIVTADEEILLGEPERYKNTKPIKYKVNEHDCWICTSHPPDKNGYPLVNMYGKKRRISRYVHELKKGQIPDGHIIMHSCDNPKCINPAHLNFGTNKRNSEDMVLKGRQARGADHGNSKLNESEVRAIREDNRSAVKIARTYGVSDVLVLKVKKRIIWRHVM